MNIETLRDHIIDNELVPTVLDSLGCGNIVDKGNYYSASNPDGDNPSAIQTFKDLGVIDYTRTLGTKSSFDIFDLVMYFEHCNFFEAIKFVCQSVGLDLYSDINEELPPSLEITKLLLHMINEDDDDYEDIRPVKPISENILTYYDMCAPRPFLDDNISIDACEEFEIGYDQLTNRITIPIRDEYNTLVGVKGRYFGTPTDRIPKYNYIERCPKGKILYGLHRALPYINRKKLCYVGESEKFVLQLVSMGYDNCCATGGKTISNEQILKLSRLNAKIVLCFDKDVEREELECIAEKFIGEVEVYAMVDDGGLLDEKESPSDCEEKWEKLVENGIVRLR